MATSLAREIAGEPMLLLADRALYWPRQSCLMVADVHLGKGDAFRSAGIALPRGGTHDDLSRLSALLQETGAEELIVLGDFLHGAVGPKPWQAQWRTWRAAHPALRVTVLTGNHDRALAGAELGVDTPGEALDVPPFALRHIPLRHPLLHVLCGHVHPVIKLPGLPGRWPAFWMQAQARCMVLPAFSRFTGGAVPRSEAGDEFVACADGELALVPSALPGSRPGSDR